VRRSKKVLMVYHFNVRRLKKMVLMVYHFSFSFSSLGGEEDERDVVEEDRWMGSMGLTG